MARPSSSAGHKQAARPGAPSGSPRPTTDRSSAPAGAASLESARVALARGDVRTARRMAKQVAAGGAEAERAAARRLLAELAPDPAALLIAALVLLVIAVAAWLALFRAH